jgi:SAM-dependent methyltransferase
MVLLMLMVSTSSAQNPEYDFYDEYGRWAYELFTRERLGRDEVHKRYREKLKSEGVDAKEIDRRINLLLHDGLKLEADWWNRNLTTAKPDFNTAPNALLVEVTKDLKPGMALDAGMGEGRNAIYLAQRGWTVTGFDIANKAMELAKKRAEQVGTKIETVVSSGREWKYEEGKWDLILYSWVGVPIDRAAEVIRSLRPKGIIVFEGRGEWAPEDRLRQAFSGLKILRLDKRRDTGADFFRGAEIPVVQFVAQKPE